MTIQPSVICACGNPKHTKKGYLVCAHCDNPCLRKANVCSFCRTLMKVKG